MHIWDWTLASSQFKGKVGNLVDVWSLLWVRFQHVSWGVNEHAMVTLRQKQENSQLKVIAPILDTRAVSRTVIIMWWTRILTNETVHVLGVAGDVWDCEAAVTDSYLTLPKRKCEVAQFIEKTTHGLHRGENQCYSVQLNAHVIMAGNECVHFVIIM